MANCKACGRWFASTNPADEICYPCNQALKRLNGYAVPVVRCKDCKYYDERYEDCNHPALWFEYCSDCGLSMNPDDFCSYGERKDNERKDN